jgi:hypothetical protein
MICFALVWPSLKLIKGSKNFGRILWHVRTLHCLLITPGASRAESMAGFMVGSSALVNLTARRFLPSSPAIA